MGGNSQNLTAFSLPFAGTTKLYGCTTRPCLKRYPSRMPLKSATTSTTRANPAKGCHNLTCPAVESVPGRVSGAWVFRDTRLPVATVIENLEDLSVEEVMEQFDVTREQIAAVLDFVAQSLKVSAPAEVSVPVDARSL